MTQSVRERAKIYTDALRSGRVYGGTEIANFIEELLDQPSPDLSKALEALKELADIVECADWTNPDMPTWEFESQLEEAKRRAREAYNSLKDKRG